MPRFDAEESPQVATDAGTRLVPERGKIVSVFQGEALKLDEAIRITEHYGAKLVVLVGDKDVGKTTLIAETHHAFLAGPVAGYRFAESQTLPGFEKRCFQARTRSRRDTADTFRTSLSTGVRLFHLGVRSETFATPTQHLLIADVSGEAFRTMRHRAEEVDKFAPFLRQAQCVTMLVSGWRLTSGKHAQHARTASRTLLNALLERRALSSSSNLQYVVTKWDCVVRADVIALADTLLGDVDQRYASRVRELTCHRLATRGGADVSLPPRFGLAELFGTWVKQRAQDVSRRSLTDLPTDARSYLRYGGFAHD